MDIISIHVRAIYGVVLALGGALVACVGELGRW
jgi:hypothetical protein